jgi:hypothetical protein
VCPAEIAREVVGCMLLVLLMLLLLLLPMVLLLRWLR